MRSFESALVTRGGMAAAIIMAAPAAAQYATGFEPTVYSGSAAGLPLAPTDGWYTPGEVDFRIFEYSGNSLGAPLNPNGSDQFVGGAAPGVIATFARAEHAVSFTAVNVWTICYDVALKYAGTLPAPNPIGSFSLEPYLTSKTFREDPVWDSTTVAGTWSIEFAVFDNLGDPKTEFGGAASNNLSANHWYRVSTVINLSSNHIKTIAVTDLETSVTTAFAPPDPGPFPGIPAAWYLAGGMGGAGLPPPSAVRLLAGGGTGAIPGNIVCIDNVSISEGEIHCPLCYANCDSSTTAPVLNVQDFTCFLTRYAAGENYANCDNSTVPPVLTMADFSCFLQLYLSGCP